MKKLLCLFFGVLILATGCNLNLGTGDSELPTVGSADKLMELVTNNQAKFGLGIELDGARAEAALGDSNSQSHSSTNVQVQGVDEADVVKTDGTYIYQVAGHRVLITQAWPTDSLKIVKEIELEGFSPSTLYVDEKYLVVLGMQQEELEEQDINGARLLWPRWSSTTRVLVYDISNMESMSLSRDISLDGYTVTSRKQENYLYLVNSRYVGWLYDGQEPVRPWFSDSDSGGKKTYIDFKDIRYFPEGELSDYILLTAIDLTSGKMNVDTYLGWAQNIYMSRDNLFVAMAAEENTCIYKFAVGSKLEYKGKGEVSGYPLNQFSMDEHNGYFRIATTEYWNRDEISSNVFILDSKMSVVGKIQNIAPGEQIYSARFMGDKGYLVTFEMVDPLFVIDLSNPRSPKILGELKIPGFSNYLHPLDDQHLLGIGQDTEVYSMDGREFVTTKGMKLAIFDVSDVNNPREKHVQTIGGRGTWSDALYDHKAVFYHNGVLALPVSVYQGSDYEYNLTFLGALFYDVDLEAGFREAGRITHNPNLDPGNDRPYSGIKRVVQIGGVYYTISDSLIMAHDADSFAQMAELELPELPEPYYWMYR